MTLPTTPTRVIAIGDPGPTQQQIVSACNNQKDFQMVDVIQDTEQLTKNIRAANPNIVIVDYLLHKEPTLDAIDEIIKQFPEIAIVAMIPENDPTMAQQVMLAGASAFLIQPFTQINLLSTLRRVRELQVHRLKSMETEVSHTEEIAKPLRTFAIFSPRGGVGTTTIAVNLAVTLKEITDSRILLIEGKLAFGHIGLMLNIRTRNSIADLIPHAGNLDEVLLRDVIVQHVSGVDVLLGPNDVQIAQGIRPQDLFNVLINLERLYEFLIIDAGSTLNLLPETVAIVLSRTLFMLTTLATNFIVSATSAVPGSINSFGCSASSTAL